MSKEELLRLVWRDAVVEENNLSVQVSTLRKVLGADALRMVSGHGYRFTLPVSPPLAWPRPKAWCWTARAFRRSWMEMGMHRARS